MEVMEWREDIEDAQAEQDEAALAALHGRFLGMEEEAVAAVAAAWCDRNRQYLGHLGFCACASSFCASPLLLGPLRKEREDTARKIFANGCLGGSGAGRSGRRVTS